MGDLNKKIDCIPEFLEKLDKSEVIYVSWKNNHELEESLSGKTDLDIFIPLQYKQLFLNIAFECKWVKVENPVAKYPWVIHLYNLGKNGQVYHLHVYFKIVTGESWLKEYVLPLDDFLIKHRVKSGFYGVWILNDKAQAYLFLLRHLIKGSSLLSRILYFRELKSYREEWDLCYYDVIKLNDYGPISLNAFIANSGLISNFNLPSIYTAFKFRLSIIPFLRINFWLLSICRINSFIHRLANKIIFRQKKVLPETGLIFAISGVDGAGKSSMMEISYQHFSQFLSVEQFSLGKPQGRIVESLRYRLNNKKSNQKPLVSKVDTSFATSIFKSLSAMILALLRLKVGRRALASARKGHLVLIDRWPTAQFGMMDGPRIVSHSDSNIIVRVCANIESWAYMRMPRADVCIFLQVPVEAAIERNRLRIKDGKESDEEIIFRHKQNQSFKPIANKIILFDNNGIFEKKQAELLGCVWDEIAKHQ